MLENVINALNEPFKTNNTTDSYVTISKFNL